MRFYYGLRRIDPTQPRILTIGNFDGVHLGHQDMLYALQQSASKQQLTSTVVLFEPQPLEYLQPAQAPVRLSSLREKICFIQQLTTIQEILCLPFTAQLAQLPAHVFVEEILINTLHCRSLLVGGDFRFGRDKQGNVSTLAHLGQSYGYQVQIAPDVLYNKRRVSSTLIRQALANNQLDVAAKLLGRPYSITGRVIPGAQRGQQMGIPTANIPLKQRKVPLQGVFAVTVSTKGIKAQGVANLGWRPTVDGTQQILEVHLLDTSMDLYGHWLTVYFEHKLRDEQHFANITALREQINRDLLAARAYFKTRPTSLF